MKNLLAYATGFISDWIALMSGAASIVLVVLAKHYSKPDLPLTWLWVAAALCFLLASYRVWLKEHESVAELTALESAPQIIFDYAFSMEGKTWNSIPSLAEQMSDSMTLRNLTSVPALNARIEPVSHYDFLATFETIRVIDRGEAHVPVTVSRGGQALTPVWKHALAHMLYPTWLTAEQLAEWNAVDTSTVPIRLTYQDVRGRKSENNSVIVFDHRKTSVSVLPGKITEIVEQDSDGLWGLLKQKHFSRRRLY